MYNISLCEVGMSLARNLSNFTIQVSILTLDLGKQTDLPKEIL